MSQKKIPATQMRGGTSKALFFRADDLPAGILQNPRQHDGLFLRLLGSPDCNGLQLDGLGGATPRTSQVAIVSPSQREDSDVDYLHGAVSINQAKIDWSGNCTGLSSAVGPFAIAQKWLAANTGRTTIRIWQQSLGKRIVAHVPTLNGEVVEQGSFTQDGVGFLGAEINLEFHDPLDSHKGGLLPTGNPCDQLSVPGFDMPIRATLIHAQDPVVIVRADALKLTGRETPQQISKNANLLNRLESIQIQAAVAMKLIPSAEAASLVAPLALPCLMIVAPPTSYRSLVGLDIPAQDMDLFALLVHEREVRLIGDQDGVALASATAIPGTIVSEIARNLPGLPTRIGHASGIMTLTAILEQRKTGWWLERVIMSHSARRLMEGFVFLPR